MPFIRPSLLHSLLFPLGLGRGGSGRRAHVLLLVSGSRGRAAPSLFKVRRVSLPVRRHSLSMGSLWVTGALLHPLGGPREALSGTGIGRFWHGAHRLAYCTGGPFPGENAFCDAMAKTVLPLLCSHIAVGILLHAAQIRGRGSNSALECLV